MFDFRNYLSLEKMKKYIGEDNKRLNNQIEPYIHDYYNRIFEFMIKRGYTKEVFDLQTEYFGNKIMISLSDFDEKRYKFERETIKKLRCGMNFKIEDKNDQYAVVNYLISEYKRELNQEVLKYRKEDLLILIYSISSVMSYISFTYTYLFKHKSKDCKKSDKAIQMSNLIVDSLGVLYESEKMWVDNLLGKQKKSCEYLINYVINQDSCKQFSYQKDIDLSKLFILAECIVEKKMVAKSIESLNKMNYELSISNGYLEISEEFFKKFRKYNRVNINDMIDINSSNANSVIREFENREGFSPKVISEYIAEFCKAKLNTEAVLNVVKDEFLYRDIQNSTGYSYNSIVKSIDSLCLKQCEKEKIDDSIFSENNRIFRTPIIRINNYFVLSNYVLTEASAYLYHRVLKQEFLKTKSFKEKVKKDYDEHELKELKELIKRYNVPGDLNLNFQQSDFFKTLVAGKGISKEIDFYFIYKKVLYIVEFKNQYIDNSLVDVCKSYSKNISNIRKQLNLISILRENICKLQEELSCEIDKIELSIVFKNKNSFTEYYTKNDIKVYNYLDFYSFCKRLFNTRI